MRKIKWTSKGRNVWSARRWNTLKDNSFDNQIMELTVRNKATNFGISMRREFDGKVKWDWFAEEQKMKAEMENDPNFVSTERPNEK